MIMVTSTEEGDSIVSQAILVKKNLAEGLKVHLRKRPFSKITVEDICAAVRAPKNGVSTRAKSFGFCSSRSVTGDKSARPATVLMMKKRVQ